MTEYRVKFDNDLELELQRLFDRFGEGGLVIKHFVGLVDNRLRAEIRANEHPPPHFHVAHDGEDASYSIETGRRLPNIVGLERYDRAVHMWWKRNRLKIVETWNASRPTECPVGEMAIPSDWS